MKGCISCNQEGTIYQKSGRLYRTNEGISCADCFVKLKRDLDEYNFLRVRVDIGDYLGKKQKRQFNRICEKFDSHKLLELLGFKFKL